MTMIPKAHEFKSLVPSWGNDLERTRMCGLVGVSVSLRLGVGISKAHASSASFSLTPACRLVV